MPERIGHYRVLGRLGAGGMGEVFLAWDERLERRVAIKRIRQDNGLSPLQRERFRREARLAARLSHSAVVQVHDIVEGPDDAIVMEYVEGRTLADLLRERLEMPEILRLAREIAEGLAAAHEAGLVHRDLKAANVIVTGSGHAKILDFGLARPVARAPDDPGFTRQGIILGTCYAMSPEQARGEEVDERSDLFSFGALVHEMLTGLPPFRGTDSIDSLHRVLTQEPVDPLLARPDLPVEAACLLRRLLQKDRDDRPDTAREVIEVLERLRTGSSAAHAAVPQGRARDLSSGAPTALELPAPFHQKPAAWSRRRILLARAIAVLLVVGAVELYQAIRSSRPPGSPDDAASAEIQDRVEHGEVRRADLNRLEEIIGTQPRSIGARVLAARISHRLFLEQREPADLKRASELVRAASEIDPSDPRPFRQAVHIALSGNRLDEAENLLERLTALVPSDPEILSLRAKLAEQQGRTAEAESLLKQALQEVASWQNQYRLADFEARHGRVEEARRQVETILRQNPENVLVRERLGHLALSYGDLDQAEGIYQGLVRSGHPERAYGNLATILALRGRHRKAADFYRRALDAQPDHVAAMINLAEVELELGHKSPSDELYRQALDRLEKIETEKGLSIYEAMSKAQCLARLGQTQDAVRIAQRQISKSPDDAHLLVQSALIHSLAGDRATARAAALAALDKGISPLWFTSPVFRWLRETPELRSRFASP